MTLSYQLIHLFLLTLRHISPDELPTYHIYSNILSLYVNYISTNHLLHYSLTFLEVKIKELTYVGQ